VSKRNKKNNKFRRIVARDERARKEASIRKQGRTLKRRSAWSGGVCWPAESTLSREDWRLVGPVISWGLAKAVDVAAGAATGVGWAGPRAAAADQSAPVELPLPRVPCLLRLDTLRNVSSTVLMGPCYREHQFALLLLGHSSSSRCASASSCLRSCSCSCSSSSSSSSYSFCFSLGRRRYTEVTKPLLGLASAWTHSLRFVRTYVYVRAYVRACVCASSSLVFLLLPGVSSPFSRRAAPRPRRSPLRVYGGEGRRGTGQAIEWKYGTSFESCKCNPALLKGLYFSGNKAPCRRGREDTEKFPQNCPVGRWVMERTHLNWCKFSG